LPLSGDPPEIYAEADAAPQEACGPLRRSAGRHREDPGGLLSPSDSDPEEARPGSGRSPEQFQKTPMQL